MGTFKAMYLFRLHRIPGLRSFGYKRQQLLNILHFDYQHHYRPNELKLSAPSLCIRLYNTNACVLHVNGIQTRLLCNSIQTAYTSVAQYSKCTHSENKLLLKYQILQTPKLKAAFPSNIKMISLSSSLRRLSTEEMKRRVDDLTDRFSEARELLGDAVTRWENRSAR